MFDKLHNLCSRRSTHGHQVESNDSQHVTREASWALPGGTASASDAGDGDGGRSGTVHDDATKSATDSTDHRVDCYGTSEPPAVDSGDIIRFPNWNIR